MNDEYTISISSSSVMTQARMTATYIANAVGSDTDFDVIASYTEHEEKLESLWLEASHLLQNQCKQFTTATESGATLTIEMSIPNHNSAMQDPMTQAANNFLANWIVAGWMDIVKPDTAEKYRTLAGSSLESFREMLYWRERPEKTEVESNTAFAPSV